MNVLQLSGMLPRDPQFRAFVSQYMVPPREPTVDEAAGPCATGTNNGE